MVWTRFMDMHSGGGQKEPPFEYIYIEAPEAEAKVVFYNRFGHNPERVSCTCCGDDYSIAESESLEQSSAFDRGCRYAYFNEDGVEVDESVAWKPGRGIKKGCVGRYVDKPGGRGVSNYQTLDSFLQRTDVLAINADDIKPVERMGEVPSQGYVWVD